MTGGVDMLEAQALGHERTVRAFSDIAVLCRTHRQLELVEKCLRHDDIPCLVTGREDFLDDPAVRGALGFLRSLVVPADNAALESALRLLWNCPADLIQKAQTLCQKMGTLDSAALQEAVRGPRHSGKLAGPDRGLAPSGPDGNTPEAGGTVGGTVRHLSGPGTPAEHGGIPRGLRQPLGCSGPGARRQTSGGHPANTGPPAQCA